MQYLFDNFFALTVTGLTLGAVYALVALGYTLVYGVLRLINFAHSEVFMYGTFAALWVVTLVGAHAGGSVGQVIFWIALMFVAAMAMSGFVAVLLERVAYRPLRKRNAPPLIALISAIGASFVLSELMGLRQRIAGWFGVDDTLRPYVANSRNNIGMAEIIHPQPVFTLGDYAVTNVDIFVIVGAVAIMVVLDQFVRRSRLGRGIRAVAMDPEAAALMGVNRDRVIQVTFLTGGVMAGAAAVFYMLKIGITRYDVGFILGVKAFTAAVLGGIGNLRGALLGGFVLGLAENYGSALVGTQWKDVVAFVLLVLILLFRPTGLLGESLGKARA
ncbi:branched-chain amino acid ABC transporter permease [Terrabacter sp. NPDC080008]|uniref:branched-chain amino acid ABC transporter permease n=1 Tax=Terrabacter sp. NPDC080008 TaxID=3155176 RepID=UPI00344F5367